MSDQNHEKKTSDPFAPPPGTEVHVYDGIVEHDNFLPRWWLGLLYGTIAFGIAYYTYYTFMDGPTLRQEYAVAMKELDASKAASEAAAPSTGGNDEASLKQWASDPAHIAQGKGVFDAKCAVCHGKSGEGSIGPNLTDDYWIHGATHVQVAATITQGVADKGMPPWGAILTPDELKSAVAFVRSLHGTNPANPKAPQGDKVAFE